jgi:hypothetical protein
MRTVSNPPSFKKLSTSRPRTRVGHHTRGIHPRAEIGLTGSYRFGRFPILRDHREDPRVRKGINLRLLGLMNQAPMMLNLTA